MLEVATGTLAAVVASALFSGGLVLQSLEARDVQGRGIAAMGELVRRRRWLLGGLAMAVGFGFHVTALLLAPLTVVQPALAAGLVVLLIAGRRIDRTPIGVREAAGVVALLAGLAALASVAPERSSVSADAGALALSLGILGALALAPIVARGLPGGAAAACAGATYALTGITTKLATDALDDSDGAAVAFWLVITAAGALAALVDQSIALQRRPAAQVGVFLYVLPVVVPVLLAPALFGERWTSSPGGGVPLVVAIVVVSAAAAVLTTSRRVAAMH